MNLHQLECFLAIVEEGGFNRATSRLHMTQPALSYQIKMLEQELGTPLFHRRPRGVRATESGRVLEHHAREVVAAVRRAYHAMEELASGVAGEIRIGTVNSVGIYFLPPVLWEMHEKYPAAHPAVLYETSDDVLEALRSGRLDMGLLAESHPNRRLEEEVLIEEHVSMVCGRTHPLFEVPSIEPLAIEQHQLISLPHDTPTGRLVQEHLESLGVRPKHVFFTPNVETAKKMVEAGLGVAFLPDMVTAADISCNGQPNPRLARIAVGPTTLTRRIFLLTSKDYELGRAAKAFVQELHHHGATWSDCAESATALG